MRTTIDLPDELFRQAKARAALEGRKLKDLIAGYVRLGLASQQEFQQDSAFVRRRSPLPTIDKAAASIRQPSGPVLSNQEMQAILDEEDAEHANRLAGR